MPCRFTRRALLHALSRTLPAVLLTPPLLHLAGAARPLWAASAWAEDRLATQLAAAEAELGGRLGISCINTADNACFSYRGDERFPLCSTFKAVLAAAVLRRAEEEPGLLARGIAVPQHSLVPHSPVTEPQAGREMTVEALCAAAMEESDNTAANMLMQLLGGPHEVQNFARSTGDLLFRLSRWEPALNSAEPGDTRDTSTPDAMAQILRKTALGDVLAPPQREKLQGWLRGCKTGGQRIRAGVPEGWQVGDKTGSGSHGTCNDIAVIWPPQGAPLVLAVYITQTERDMAARNALIRNVTRRLCAAWRV